MGGMNDLILIGDEAFTESELREILRRREYKREYRSRPEVRAKYYERTKKWAEANKDRLRVYNREWKRANRPRFLSDEQLAKRIAYHEKYLHRYLDEQDRRREKAA